MVSLTTSCVPGSDFAFDGLPGIQTWWNRRLLVVRLSLLGMIVMDANGT